MRLDMQIRWGLGVLFVLGGCGAAPVPRELSAARTAYAEAAAGEASRLASPELYAAQEALEGAERHWREEGDDQDTRHLARLARQMSLAAQRRAADIRVRQERAREAIQAERNAEEARLREARQQALHEAEAALEAERQQAVSAEEAAAERLEVAHAFSHDSRGLVIRFPGDDTFEGDTTALKAAGRARLLDAALVVAKRPGRVLVEVHSDAGGGPKRRLKLCQARAEAVVDVLAEAGIPRERMLPIGLGNKRPIADTRSTEGQAQNRRVEIVVVTRAEGVSQVNLPRM